MSPTIDQPVKTQPWYERHEKAVQWLTLLSVIAGASLHYILVDSPAVNVQEESRRLTLQLIEESKKNQKLLEKKLQETQVNTEALNQNMEQIKSQIQLSKVTIEQMQDPTRKTSEHLQLERQNLERVIYLDELIDSLAPNFQVKLQPDLIWNDQYVGADLVLINAGKRTIWVENPTITVSVIPTQGSSISKPKKPSLQVKICSAGSLSPGETLQCAINVKSNISLSSIAGVSYKAEFFAHTYLPEASETLKKIQAEYDSAYLESRMSKHVTATGNLLR